jgi:hypothetical protein
MKKQILFNKAQALKVMLEKKVIKSNTDKSDIDNIYRNIPVNEEGLISHKELDKFRKKITLTRAII